jgi:hypothetical protein
MLLPFRRSAPSRPGYYRARRGSYPTQRHWMVDVLLAPLSPVVQEALRAWLLAPTDLWRWPPPETFSAQREPLRPQEYWDEPADTACELLYNELRAIRQTLDLPPEALSGLTRNGLLTVHAIRLRQLEWRLWPGFTARKIREMIAWPGGSRL